MLEGAVHIHGKAQVAFSFIVLSLVYIVYTAWKKTPSPLDDLPWAGLPKGRFARLRARFSVSSQREEILSASEKYTFKGKAFVWQEFLGNPLLVLPASCHRWLLDQPHDVISGHEYLNDWLALDTSAMNSHVHVHSLHTKVVSNNLNRALSWTSGPVMDELSKCFDEKWGFSAEWQDHVIVSDLLSIVARTVNRMFIGTELCRNESFLKNVVRYATLFIVEGMLLRPVPAFLRKVLAYPITIPITMVFNKLYGQLKPIIKQRMADLERKAVDPDFSYEVPNDYLQWLITTSYQSPFAKDTDPRVIAERFLSTNFAAIHTTTMNSTSLLLDLASTEPTDNIIGQIRDQIVAVHRTNAGKWDKAGLAKLTLLDSALRETLRLTGGGGTWTPSRKVVAKAGVTLPDGVHLPYGTDLCIPSWIMHRSSRADFLYDPFRWARARSEHTQAGGHEELVKERSLQATATSLDYLPFSHGRDACPGRFFAVQEIKLMMVHVLLNYEIKPYAKRPEDFWISDMVGPPQKAKITVRKIAPPALDE